MPRSDKVLCIYHKNCTDGFAAAWAARAYYGEENIEFRAADYMDPIPDIKGRDVLLVDFSYRPERLLPLAEEARGVVIIDHHKSAIEAWKGVQKDGKLPSAKVTFISNDLFSGAVLTWRHFFPSSPIPKVISLIQDYDLWEHSIPRGRDIITGIKARGIMQREAWDEFTNIVAGDLPLDVLADEGVAINRAYGQLLDDMLARTSKVVSFMGFEVPVANVPYEFRDAAGERLCHNHLFAVTYDDWAVAGKRKFSLRAQRGNGFSVEKLARIMGGGGHESAASFTLPLTDVLGTYLVTK